MKKRILLLSTVLVLFASIIFFPRETQAATLYSGNCGLGTASSVTWTLSDDGVFTISGSGTMQSYGLTLLSSGAISKTDAPWWSYRKDIKSVVITGSVKNIGTGAFAGASNLTSITWSSASMEEIGSYAFYGCSSLKTVTLPNSLYYLDGYAFMNCTGLTSVTFGDGMETLHGDPDGDENESQYCSVYTNSYQFKGCTSLNTVSIMGGTSCFDEDNAHNCFYGLSTATTLVYRGSTKQWAAIVQKLPDFLRYASTVKTNDNSADRSQILIYSDSTAKVYGDGQMVVADISSISLSSPVYSGLVNTLMLPASLKSVAENSFSDFSSLQTVYFLGNDTQRADLQANIETGNDYLLNASWETHTHNYSVEKVVKSTCTTDGYTAKTCICGAEGEHYNVISATGHPTDSVSSQEVVTATCTQMGKVRKYCNVCGERWYEYTAMTEHRYLGPYTMKSTCTSQGYIYKECATCERQLISEYLPLADHQWSKTSESELAYCSACNRCEIEVSTPELTVTRCEEDGPVAIICKYDTAICHGDGGLIYYNNGDLGDIRFQIEYMDPDAPNAQWTVLEVTDPIPIYQYCWPKYYIYQNTYDIPAEADYLFCAKAIFQDEASRINTDASGNALPQETQYTENKELGEVAGHEFLEDEYQEATYERNARDVYYCTHGCGEIRVKEEYEGTQLLKTDLANTQIELSLSTSYVYYTGSAIEPTLRVLDGSNTVSPDYYTISYSNNTEVGVATVTVEAKSGDIPYSGSVETTFEIVPKQSAISSVTCVATGMTVKWSKVSNASGYYIYRSQNGGSYTKVKTITSPSTVSYTDTKAIISCAKYSYKVVTYYKTSSGIICNGASSAAKTSYFVTRPTLSGLKNSSSKKMTVQWYTISKGTYIQIQYSTSSTFAKGNKTVTFKRTSNRSKTISSLSKGKTYYVRMRTYYIAGGNKYYSAWSAKKHVKITK